MRRILKNGNILNVRTAAYQTADIVIEEDKIVEIIPQTGNLQNTADNGAEVIDCTGRYLTPGVIDAHVHLVWDGRSSDPMQDTVDDGNYICFARGIAGGLDSLRAGVTTVRDVGCNDDCTLPMANAINRGIIEGPTIIPCGSAVQGSYGHCPMIGFIANTESQLIERIKKSKAYNVAMRIPPQHWIKIMTSGGAAGLEDVGPCMYSPKELDTIAYEAHRLNMKVASHALSYDAIEKCVHAGIDTIEHGADLTPELLRIMKEQGQAWVPTVGVYKTLSESRGIVADHLVDKSLEVVKKHRIVLQNALEIGTTVLLGSDAGSANFGPHPSAFVEMFTLYEYGMKAEDIIRAATIVNAETLGFGSSIGSLEVGKKADILVLGDDPLKNIYAFRDQLKSVYKNGKRVCI